jgi:divalent metal cation (Fe/Co/Zn/Cd) transporter
MHGCMHEVNKSRGTQSLWTWFRETRSSELLVIFGEDLAALLGLVLALAAVLLTVVTGDPMWDALGTLAIGVLLVVVAVLVATEVKDLLIGQGMDPERERELRAFIHARPEIVEVISLITLQLGDRVMLAVHARMHEHDSAVAMLEQTNAVERAIKAAFPEILWSFFEPDLPQVAG